MDKLLNGKRTQTKYVTFLEYYEELNERNKAELRQKLAKTLNCSIRTVYKRIAENNFNTEQLRAIWEETNISHCPKQGFFLDTDVAKMETLKKYGLAF